MPVRQFTDPKGVQWRVWSTMPAADSPLNRYYPGGWLTFDNGSGETLRRISPAPSGWELASAERLYLMCRAAEEVPRHTGKIPKMARPDSFEGLTTPVIDLAADEPLPAPEPLRPIDPDHGPDRPERP